MSDNDSIDHSANTTHAPRNKALISQDIGGCAQARSLPRLERHNMIGQPTKFAYRVRDIEDRQATLVSEPLKIGQQVSLARAVKRSQWLVREKDLRPAQKRPPKRHTLCFTARKFRRPARQKPADAKKFYNTVKFRSARRLSRKLAAIVQVCLLYTSPSPRD